METNTQPLEERVNAEPNWRRKALKYFIGWAGATLLVGTFTSRQFLEANLGKEARVRIEYKMPLWEIRESCKGKRLMWFYKWNWTGAAPGNITWSDGDSIYVLVKEKFDKEFSSKYRNCGLTPKTEDELFLSFYYGMPVLNPEGALKEVSAVEVGHFADKGRAYFEYLKGR